MLNINYTSFPLCIISPYTDIRYLLIWKIGSGEFSETSAPTVL